MAGNQKNEPHWGLAESYCIVPPGECLAGWLFLLGDRCLVCSYLFEGRLVLLLVAKLQLELASCTSLSVAKWREYAVTEHPG